LTIFVPEQRAPTIHGDLCYILLSCGNVAFLDADDYGLVSHQEKWCLTNIGGYVSYKTYSQRKRIRHILHNILMEPPSGFVVDHKNGNPLDNRRENLRIATILQNNQNRCSNKNSTSPFKGVSWEEDRQKWRVQIFSDGKKIHIGRFDDQIEAAKAYNVQAAKYQGEFARLNTFD